MKKIIITTVFTALLVFAVNAEVTQTSIINTESVQDVTQIEMMDLQEQQQKTSFAMQIISNILKLFHDTASSLVSNMK